MPRLRTRSCARRLFGVVVALALFALQATTLAHAIRHAPLLAAVAVADDQGDVGHDAGSPVCQLVDQILSGQATAFTAVTVPTAHLAEAQVDRAVATVRDRGLVLAYAARAPPPAS
jgi:hypothetical protein